MKNKIYGALIALALSFVSITQVAQAQVYGEFLPTITVQANYEPLVGGTVIPSTNFILPPSTTGFPARDNGYFKIAIPWSEGFEYNGDIYKEVWICTNGFIQFLPVGQTPLALPQALGNRLFINDAPNHDNLPRNVIAPFWGDHVYRDGSDAFAGYMVSSIIHKADNNNTVLTIEWRNMNVNVNEGNLQSSVANFQVKLYKSADPNTNQGDIEFCYGTIGGNTSTTLTTVVTRNAAVGIRGEFSDFANGLIYDAAYSNGNLFRTSNTLTNAWPPSGATNRRIRFNAKRIFNIEEWWGDGDADFSKAQGRIHFGLPQNRFATINDVRTILRSIATKKPLDSLRRRAAYHADVDHNGRFFYTIPSGTLTSVRTNIENRDLNYGDNLPAGISSIKQVYYQTTEKDAAIILNYLSGKVPALPWRYDTIPNYGKETISGPIANSIRLGEARNEDGKVIVPVYLNGNATGATSIKFDVNSNVLNVIANSNDENTVFTDFNANRVVIAASGKFTENDAIAFIELNPTNGGIQLTDVTLNDKNIGNIITNNNDVVDNTSLVSTPNPFNTLTNINFEISEAGVYSLSIYDAFGKQVKVLNSNFLNKGAYKFEWDGTSENNTALPNGVYVAKLASANSTQSVKLMLTK
jgi:hypothetical protein